MCIYTHNTLTQAHKTMANPKRMNRETLKNLLADKCQNDRGILVELISYLTDEEIVNLLYENE